MSYDGAESFVFFVQDTSDHEAVRTSCQTAEEGTYEDAFAHLDWSFGHGITTPTPLTMLDALFEMEWHDSVAEDAEIEANVAAVRALSADSIGPALETIRAFIGDDASGERIAEITDDESTPHELLAEILGGAEPDEVDESNAERLAFVVATLHDALAKADDESSDLLVIRLESEE